jgi:hypothetical protein
LEISANTPETVTLFAESAARHWQPCEIFVMDIAEHQGGLRIIEINGFNSSGFYAADIPAIVAAVSHAALG